jgi:hypothetical protein
MWEADLGETGRRLTPDELTAMESMHQCQLLGRLVVAAESGLAHLRSLEGRVDRLETYLALVDPLRYPRSTGHPLPALPAVEEAAT